MSPLTTALSRMFELLAEGAPAESFAEVTAAAVAAGLGGAELTEVRRAAETASRVRRALRQHRRREAELSALFETASDLAALRDTDAVLRSIVHRARTLLGTDVAYLSLNDEAEGDTYMRVTDGSVSALFQQLRLGMGEGLGGLVAQTCRPYATAEYPTDARFHHTQPIDRAVLDEGLVAILGVPLTVGDRVLGVLFAADRAPRAFSPDEVALLSSLADHAAIALDTARLLEDTRAALDELNAAHGTIRAHNAAMRRAEQSHDQLTDLVLRGADVPEVAAAVATVLGGGIVVHDAEGAELARVAADPLPAPTSAVRASRASGHAVPTDDGWVCAVSAGAELLGSVVLSGRPDLGDADRRLFERAGVVTALLLLLRRSVAEAENRVRGELVNDLVSAPGRDPAGLVARARRLGVDLRAGHVVLVGHADDDARDRLATAAVRHARAVGGLAGAYGAHAVLVLPGMDAGNAARVAASELGTAVGGPVTVGAAGPASGPEALSAAHGEAARCLRAMLATGHSGHGASLAELGFLGVLLGDRADVNGFVAATLGPVLDYDARRGTELVHTLAAYFANGANLTRTRTALHVHVNTVVQRLERVRSLLGPDWQQPDRALEIQIALRLHQLATAD
ncbi:helix-turn-helix domain-containing protein [Streptoalloteichus hindustanus]|nr:GAF domain-containing protein [Streptoalloteichus hindustanus]